MTTTTCAGALAPGVSVDVGSFADLTAAAVVSVEQVGGLVAVTFDGTLSAEQVRDVIRRISLAPAAVAALADIEARVTALESP